MFESPSENLKVGRKAPALVVLILLFVYSLTASWSFPYPIDPLGNVIAGWHLGKAHSFVFDEFEDVRIRAEGRNSWLIDSLRGPTTQYPPGMTLLLAPAYAVFGAERLQPMTISSRFRDGTQGVSVSVPVPNLWPGTAVAVVATSASFGLLAAVLVHLRMNRIALGAALVGGLGTSAWAVASTAPFQHGPTMMLVAGFLLSCFRSRWGWAGLMISLATVIRPPVLLIGLAAALTISIRRRDWRPGFWIGLMAAIGIAVILGYNRWMFGLWSISGGYGSDFSDRLVQGDLVGFGANVLGGLFDPFRGVLIASSFLLVLLPGVRSGIRNSPDWVVGSALGGLIYLLFVWKANRYSGGDGHWSYRYPLEALMAAGPLLAAAFIHWTSSTDLRLRLFRIGVVVATTLQAVGAVL